MEKLTTLGKQKVQQIANQYGVSEAAVTTLLQAVKNGNGTMAQFSHPELGGYGQWMRGGMTMIGDMFNNNLKAKVDNMAHDLSNLLQEQGLFESSSMDTFAPSGQWQTQGDGYTSASFMSSSSFGQWWPVELGSPSSSGAQNDSKYAIVPAKQRLAILSNGQVTVYDTKDHQIYGVSQQQGGVESMTFTSQYGTVKVTELPVVK